MKNIASNLFILSILLLGACAALDKQPLSHPNDLSPLAPEITEPKADGSELTSNLVYDTLTSEIAAQRGEHQMAFAHAMRAAQRSRQPAAAERATHLALHANLPLKAMQAAKLWIELAPDSLKAHQISSLLYAKTGEPNKIIYHLQEVIRIANQNGQDGYLQAAAIAEKAGTPDQSLMLMRQLIPNGSDDPNALYALSLSASRARQYSLAEETIKQALEIKPGWPKGLLLLSRTLILQNKKSEGLRIMAQSVKIDRKNNELRLAYARMLIENQQLEGALEQFNILAKAIPDNAEFIYALGIISTELKHFDSAKGYFLRLIALGKRQGDANYNLGAIAEFLDESDKAYEYYRLVDGTNQADARIRMAKILQQRGQLDKARELLQQLRIDSPQHDLKLRLIEAELLRDAKQYSVAHELYSQALEQYKDNTDLLYARALNAAELRRVDILEQDLNRILQQNPEHVDALNALGYTLADQTDRFQEAYAYIKQALALKPDNPAILDSMGWVSFRMGHLEEALKYLQKAAKISPDAEIASHLGEVLWHLGRKPQALKVWSEAEAHNPGNDFIKPVRQRLGAEP